MPRNRTILLLLFFIFAFCLSSNGVHAFGAGNIPSFAYMEGRAFRHGDIEDILSTLAKKGAGGGFVLASMLGGGGSKFNGLDIKRIYFGNWLRDYSQAVDIASLKKLQLQTIINLCMVLGFMAHGYATHEFEVTAERLGVYLPTEHIDNPKGYGAGEDPRQYHPQLRPPVDVCLSSVTPVKMSHFSRQPRELEIDPRTGMKNYIANEQGHWDTSKALVRRTLERCIHHGRQHRANGDKKDEYEAYRLLGQLLHTLEDFPAHSNFCELALVSLGHQQVFVHVGDQVRIHAPNGKTVAPIVTGSFGSSDFIYSLLGEAGDHLASVSDLNKELDKARAKSQTQSRSGPGGAPADPADVLRDLLFSLPGGADSEMSRDLDNINRIRAGPSQGGKRPEEMSPQELHGVLWQVLTFRDSVVKKIAKTIQMIPGLGPLIQKITDSINVFVLTTLEPFLKPILKSATGGLSAASGEVINNHDQYEVFNDSRVSDPTHSFLSKDHFNLILNEPAGHLARIIVVHAAGLVIKSWDDNSVNVHQISEEILQCLFHPDFHDKNSKVQREMMQYMADWVSKLGGKQHATLQRLSKQAVRNHENIRLAGDGGAPASQGSFADSQAHNVQHALAGYAQSHIPGFSQAQSVYGSRDGPGGAGEAASYYSNNNPKAPGPVGSSYAPPPGGSSYTPPAPHGGGTSSYASGRPTSPPTSSYAPPPGPPPPHGPHSSYSSGPSGYSGGGASSYAPPSGPPPSSYVAPTGPPRTSSYPYPGSPTQSGYTPAYAPVSGHSSPPPSFPGAAPSFPGAAPSFPGAAPSFPGGPDHDHGHHGHGHGHGGYTGGGYAPPSGPPPHGGAPGYPGASGGYGPPSTGSPFGFPDADQYPGSSPPQFPNAGPRFPQGGGGW
ncbi:uncharacterized protein LACBIDRAFT_297529 [Laccaria bicolor S238N-H82]|uniref:Predicted protein n=1 Tax=Laccaria bicolor (strain S238N-H82 / ATCC MYA-4686) TaxID=486041 RepID=B0DBE4_LACBS|nr:uncharacterized protein LACBIDRAFT_297529 [Laccaria bicolor S238N-H82]EDR07977.1 predicted protein [Laccaria bicolor S238N-H82]|eukprot:XP_001881047.1 predicted protein [Laccaria bicolor S238N-H82]